MRLGWKSQVVSRYGLAPWSRSGSQPGWWVWFPEIEHEMPRTYCDILDISRYYWTKYGSLAFLVWQLGTPKLPWHIVIFPVNISILGTQHFWIYACRNANRQHVCRGLSLYPSRCLGYPPPIMAGRRVLAVPSVYCALFLSKSIYIYIFYPWAKLRHWQDRRCLGRRKPKRFRDSDENMPQQFGISVLIRVPQNGWLEWSSMDNLPKNWWFRGTPMTSKICWSLLWTALGRP